VPKTVVMFSSEFVCLFVCLFVLSITQKIRIDFDEMFCRGREWPKDQVIRF